MKHEELDRIETTLNIKLPEYYRSFMIEYPSWLTKEQPSWSDVTRWEFANDPDRIIEFNGYVRECDPDEFFDDIAWPDHYFIIGSEQDQNWYFLDLKSKEQAVFLYHHEMGEVVQVAASLAEFPSTWIKWWKNVGQVD